MKRDRLLEVLNSLLKIAKNGEWPGVSTLAKCFFVVLEWCSERRGGMKR